MKIEMAIRAGAVAAACAVGLVVGGIWSSQTAIAGSSDDWAGLPEAVRAAFQAQRPGETPTEIEQETSDGKTTYEAEYRGAKGDSDITVDAAGALVVVKNKLKAKDLPEAIKKAVEAKYPGAKIKEAESTSRGDYELGLNVSGKKVEVIAQKDGKIGANVEEEDDDDEEEDDDDAGKPAAQD